MTTPDPTAATACAHRALARWDGPLTVLTEEGAAEAVATAVELAHHVLTLTAALEGRTPAHLPPPAPGGYL